MQGWIKIDRKIQNHWIFKDPDKFKAWITILLEVNHADTKVLIKDSVLNVNRGESLNSLNTWVEKFGKNWNKSKVRRFFDLLEKCDMIQTKSETVTTRLIVCKYESYQGERNASETQVKRKRNATETQVTPNKNENNEYNEKNDKNIAARKQSFLDQLKDVKKETDSSKMLNDFFLYWTEHGVNDKKMRFEKEKSFGMARRLSRWRINQGKFEPKQSRSEYINQELNKHFGNNEPEPEQTHDIDYTEISADDFKGL